MPTESLTDFIEQVTGDSHLRVENDLGDGFVVLKVSEAERRQARHDVRSTEDIVIEMLRNARDAHARNIFLATARDGAQRRITMLDDGDGIPSHMQKRIFDARVTSKLDTMHVDTWGVHGRGMALYAVRLNSCEAYVADSVVGGGSSLVVVTDTSALPEKVDQSSMPTFHRTDSGTVVVRGARNINRTVAEFAYADGDTCTVYLGSPVEIAATLWEFGRVTLPVSTRAFCADPQELPVCKRLAAASTPEEFSQIALGIGLELSERSARRIMDGDIAALAPLIERISIGGVRPSKGAAKRPHASDAVRIKDQRGLKLSHQDAEFLKGQAVDSFKAIAPSYYLEEDVEAALTVRKDAIHIRIPLKRLD